MIAEINGASYRVEFGYRRPDAKPRVKHPRFHGSAACVIICDDAPRKFIAIGQSICSAKDRCNRREARAKAFEDAVEGCGLLKGTDVLPFFNWFWDRFPAPAPPAKHVAKRLSDVEIAWRKEQGRMRKAAAQ